MPPNDPRQDNADSVDMCFLPHQDTIFHAFHSAFLYFISISLFQFANVPPLLPHRGVRMNLLNSGASSDNNEFYL